MTLRRPRVHVLFGTILLSTASITKMALQFVLVPVLARILGPRIFGEMSVAMSFVLLANMLSDGGMGPALVRESHPDGDLKSTIFWLSLLIGSALATAICIIAWPVSLLFKEPELFAVLCALSPILILSAALAVSNSEIVRVQRFDYFAAGDIGCAIVSAVVGLGLAFSGYGIWSLVGQQLTLWITKAIWISSVSRFRPRFVLRMKLARPLFRFSANNLAANVADFTGRATPIMIVSGILGIPTAGQYSMGYQLTNVVNTVVSNPVNVATFSAVAGAANRHAAASFVTKTLRVLMIVVAPLCAGIMLTADLAAPLLLGSKWAETAPVLVALTPGALVLCLNGFAGSAILGRGRSSRVFKLTLLTSIAMAAGTAIGAEWGVPWAAAGFSIGASLIAPLYAWSLARAVQIRVRDLLSPAMTGVIAVAVMSAAVLVARSQMGALAPLVQLAVAVAVGVATFAAIIWLLDGDQIRSDIASLRRANPDVPFGSGGIVTDAGATDIQM